MQFFNNQCPICRSQIQKYGVGEFCPYCGYVHIPTPLTNEVLQAEKKKKTIKIVVLCVLFIYVIPQIILLLLL